MERIKSIKSFTFWFSSLFTTIVWYNTHIMADAVNLTLHFTLKLMNLDEPKYYCCSQKQQEERSEGEPKIMNKVLWIKKNPYKLKKII